MERFLVLCILFLAAVSAEESLNFRDDADFLRWSSMHLEAGRDLATIYPVWKRNAEFVRAQNSLKLPYTVSMNKFGHLVKCKEIFFGSAAICAASHTPVLQGTCKTCIWLAITNMSYIALKIADLGVIQSHQCNYTGCISANTRPHKLCWGNWEMMTACVSCTVLALCSGVTNHSAVFNWSLHA